MNQMQRFGIRALAVALGLQSAITAFAITTQQAFAAGTADNIASHVVISEILTRPNSDQFIELYNPTGTDISLNGWSVQYKDGTSSFPASLVASFSATNTIKAHGYYLIRPTGSSASIAADLESPTLSLQTTGGNVILANDTTLVNNASDANIVDHLGYGNANSYEGSAAATAPATGESLERHPGVNYTEGNGVDTDKNNLDFSTQTAPNPKNATSATEQYAAPTISNISISPSTKTGYTTIDKPTLSFVASDMGSGFTDATNFSVTIDGTTVIPQATVAADMKSASVSATPAPLVEGTHTAVFTATDNAGFVTTQSWSFTVDTISPSVNVKITDTAPKTDHLATTINITATDATSGIDQMQVAFDGAFDSEPWEPFQATVTRNLRNWEGLQGIAVRVMDKAGKISETAIAYTTLQFRPVTAPVNATSHTTGNSITIWWPTVSSASGYLVRFNDGTVLYGPIRTNNTMLTISNLDLSKTYHFEVAAVDQSGNVTAYTPVYPDMPKATLMSTTTTTTEVASQPTESSETTTTPRYSSSNAGKTAVSPSPTPAATISPAPSATPGEIKSSDDSKKTDWTKVIVAISILIIAAGVATGGWYLYQWWSTTPKDKNKGKGGRW